MGWLQDFKKFLLKGNLVILAVAFVMGVVFAALVKAFIADLITPIIALIFGKPNFAELSFTINGSHFYYGDFINALITFATTALAVFLFVVKPYEAADAKWAKEDTSVKNCPECTLKIPGRGDSVPRVHGRAVRTGRGAGTSIRLRTQTREGPGRPLSKSSKAVAPRRRLPAARPRSRGRAIHA